VTDPEGTFLSNEKEEEAAENPKRTTERDRIHLPAAAPLWAAQVALLLLKDRTTEEKSQRKMWKSELIQNRLIQQMIECPWLNLWAQFTFEWTLLKFD